MPKHSILSFMYRAGVTRQRLSHHCETPSLQSHPVQQRLQLRQVGGFTPQNANWRPGQLPLRTGEIFFPVGRSFDPTANRQTARSWHFNCFSETPALMPCSAHGTTGAPSEPLARQSSSSQVNKKVAIVSVVTETDPSGENPQLWYTTHTVSPEGCHIDGIIWCPSFGTPSVQTRRSHSVLKTTTRGSEHPSTSLAPCSRSTSPSPSSNRETPSSGKRQSSCTPPH